MTTVRVDPASTAETDQRTTIPMPVPVNGDQALGEHQHRDEKRERQIGERRLSHTHTNDTPKKTNSNTVSNFFRSKPHQASGAEVEHIEHRLVPHHYWFERPRALQYSYKGERIAFGDDAAPIGQTSSHNNIDIKYDREGLSKARDHIDLFIDLVWVGIISNLSEVFSVAYFEEGHSTGDAFLMFLIVFLPAWRIWNFLREFLNGFFMDDPIQRAFILWILVLSVFFGNNIAYFPENYESVKVILITTYLVIRASFVIITLIYSICIRWYRTIAIISFFVAWPSTGLWVAASQVHDHGTSVGLAFAAIIWEYAIPLWLDTQVSDRFTPGEYQKEIDPQHIRARMGNFLIITIGEGVLTLVRGGPLGEGISTVASIATWSLIIYFILAYLYFIRDNSVSYVPAVRHRGFRAIFWISWHIPLFAAFISLSSGILFFINRNAEHPVNNATPEISEEVYYELSVRALGVIAASLSVIMLSYTAQALLDKPLDPPGTLLVNNRLLRLAGRPLYILLICLVLLDHEMNVYLYMGICGLGLFFVLLWETVASLERPCRMFEPRGLSTLMKKEMRSHGGVANNDGSMRIVV